MAKVTKRKAGRPNEEWPSSKVILLKKLYPRTVNAEVAKQLGITVSALRNAAVRFKVKKSNRYWDKPEEKYLLDNWEVMSPVEIAEGLKKKFKIEKTKWSVINKYRELKGLR